MAYPYAEHKEVYFPSMLYALGYYSICGKSANVQDCTDYTAYTKRAILTAHEEAANEILAHDNV